MKENFCKNCSYLQKNVVALGAVTVESDMSDGEVSTSWPYFSMY